MRGILSAILFVVAAVDVTIAGGPRPFCSVSNQVDPTEACDSIAETSGVNVSQILALNVNATCSPEVGTTPVCLRKTDLNCTLNATATETTCNSLASSFNLTTAQFVQLNDDVDDACDDLVVGVEYCVSVSDCFPGNTNTLCQGNV